MNNSFHQLKQVFTFSCCHLLVRSLYKSFKNCLLKAYVYSFAIKRLWLQVSKTFDRSIKTAPQNPAWNCIICWSIYIYLYISICVYILTSFQESLHFQKTIFPFRDLAIWIYLILASSIKNQKSLHSLLIRLCTNFSSVFREKPFLLYYLGKHSLFKKYLYRTIA